MVLARPLSLSVRRNRATAFSAAIVINILCLWLLQYGVRAPARLRLPTRKTLVELIPLASPAPARPAIPAPTVPTQHASTHLRPAPPSRTAITLAQPLTRPDTPRPVASEPVRKLDMEALRNSARDAAGQGNAPSAIELNLKPQQEAAQTALGREMGKAQRASCKTAHANLLLLAPLALLHDTVTDTGCNWQQ
ncbi:hypothetical protein [Silvimonas iriomotensis]|uniref:Uncharacterized protein n=1 Tax=Silvimonas iriomotensis TaxID=449662 RepID=A0ABQ2PAE2_9NEIS|nr:hypothetical protein [Silvimonas iriomotensis]GGP22073.1 hypothetical protein GCM10010970_23410 [Silvimonas iriomotensis]